MLEVRGLCRSFGGMVAVRDVTTTIESGRINAFIGPNGAGKTTLFNLVSGCLRPSAGSVALLGRDITRLRPDQIAVLGVARTFQTTSLFETASVIDNLMVGHRLRTRSGLVDALWRTRRQRDEQGRCRDVAARVLDFVGLDAVGTRAVGSITQEEKRRVAFALALATEPSIVLLDEPAGGLNPDETLGIGRLIRKIVDSGITVCLIEHKMNLVMSLADKIVVLHHGEKIAEGAPREIQANEAVIEAYLGSEQCC